MKTTKKTACPIDSPAFCHLPCWPAVPMIRLLQRPMRFHRMLRPKSMSRLSKEGNRGLEWYNLMEGKTPEALPPTIIVSALFPLRRDCRIKSAAGRRIWLLRPHNLAAALYKNPQAARCRCLPQAPRACFISWKTGRPLNRSPTLRARPFIPPDRAQIPNIY